MFIGHYALGLAAKRLAPRTSLGTLFFAPQLADLVWPVCLLLGWEHAHAVPGPNPFLILWFDAFPISHSLLALLAWGLVCAALYHRRTGYRRGAAVVGLLVLSHWLLDAVVHRPDLPLYPGGARVGLGLWQWPAATLIVEGVMFGGGIWVYLRGTRARDTWGRAGFAGLLAVLGLSYGATLAAGAPPSMRTVALGAIVFGWGYVGWAGWVDRHRDVVADTAGRGGGSAVAAAPHSTT